MVRWYKSSIIFFFFENRSIIFIFKSQKSLLSYIPYKRKKKKAHSMEYGDFSLPTTHEDKIPTSNRSGPTIKGLQVKKQQRV